MIAIIPARGGSKGLPGKNIKLLNEKPLIAYTIEAAIKSKKVDRVIVSTDCDKIAKIALQYGAEIPFIRPDFLATDTASSIDVFKYTCDRLEKQENISIKNFIVLQPTSPLRTSKHIDEAITLFKDKKAESVISFCKEVHPIFWHKFINDEGQFEDVFMVDDVKNRQDTRATYYPNGAIYVFDKSILETGQYYTKKSYAYIMEREVSVDIDTLDDFKYIEFLMNKL